METVLAGALIGAGAGIFYKKQKRVPDPTDYQPQSTNIYKSESRSPSRVDRDTKFPITRKTWEKLQQQSPPYQPSSSLSTWDQSKNFTDGRHTTLQTHKQPWERADTKPWERADPKPWESSPLQRRPPYPLPPPYMANHNRELTLFNHKEDPFCRNSFAGRGCCYDVHGPPKRYYSKRW